MKTLGTTWCSLDQPYVPIVQDQPNHILHLLLTVFTFGAWLIVWLVIMARQRPMRCGVCGVEMRARFEEGVGTVIEAKVSPAMLPAHES